MSSSTQTKDAKATESVNGTDVYEVEGGLNAMIMAIVDDTIYNIVHDIVVDVHASEKKQRMVSAAVQVENQAMEAAGLAVSASSATKPTSQPVAAPPTGVFTTKAATYDNGKVTLQGNPLKTLDENYCPSCKNRRFMFPLIGANSRVPANIDGKFCSLHPFIRKPNHDIYGNPFPVDSSKSKKEREALRKKEREEKDNTPASADTGADGDSVTGEAKLVKHLPGGKGSTYVPWHTCPSCKRSLLITKFAMHLEKCMGIGGRAVRSVASRASGRNGTGNGSGTTSAQGSRVGTPSMSQVTNNGKREAADDSDKDEGPPKKKVKKDKKIKKDDGGKVTIKISTKKGEAAKRIPKDAAKNREGTPKRDRDEADGKEGSVKKKQKTSRETEVQG